MKIRILLPMLLVAAFLSLNCKAQSEKEPASAKAMQMAQNLLQYFQFAEWDQYLALSYPGVVKYYGGRNGFLNYVQRARKIYKDSLTECAEKIRILQIENDILEWQCVIEKIREGYQHEKKIIQITYIIGQSKDDGINWTFFDVAHNSLENVIYIMPDIFSNLAIPQRKLITQSDLGYKSKTGKDKSALIKN